MSTLSRHRVAVRGGGLVVGVWNPEVPAPRTILAIHGITASHLAWISFAEQFPEVRIIAPDLRGRGGSSDLPGPWGMQQHAEDMLAVLDCFDTDEVLVVGHSMGAFVAATLAAAHPERVTGVVLVDGGLPIPLPEGVTRADLPDALIGPAAERLSMTFADASAYRDFWRGHPAFGESWGPVIERYVDYDLIEGTDGLRSSSSLAAVTEDSLQLNDDVGYLATLKSLTMPLHFVRAPRGLLNEPVALYPPTQLEYWARELPRMVVHEIQGVNHYTIVMTPSGIAGISPIVRIVLDKGLPAVGVGRLPRT
jgi:lipase